MIVVTGATGQLGGMVVDHLLQHVPAEDVAIAVRNPEAATALAGRGVEVRHGDADEPETLQRAFDGADRLLLVSLPRLGDDLVRAHAASIDAARRAGVGRLLYTSHIGADVLSAFPPAVGHGRTEALLQDSGLPFTALRNGFYADTPVRWAQQAAASGELRLPADGPVSWTTREDQAAAIAALLLDGGIDRPVVNLTAAEALDAAALADVVSSITGTPVRRIVESDEEHRRRLIGAGVPESGAEMALAIVVASRQRRFSIVDPELERLVGRPATPMRDLVAAAL